jgi:transcriptional regulator with GAF, ATPase, and Fis domain
VNHTSVDTATEVEYRVSDILSSYVHPDPVKAEGVVLQEEICRTDEIDEIVGESPELIRVLHQVDQVAPTDSSVLIEGETGTGKELVALAIHQRSRRSKRALIKVNCAALPAQIIESELFGHERGAFTGAIARKIGRFELADGATLFLDEIGELPLELQAKLLRVLQSGEFERVGSSKTLHADVRIIAATNRNLRQAVEEGRFRDDLYYRLGVFPIEVPPLRERKEDIPLLTVFFLDRLRGRLGKRIDRIDAATFDRLSSYSWPGNIRELANVVERAMIGSPGRTLLLEELPPAPAAQAVQAVQERRASHVEPPPLSPPLRPLADVERDHIRLVCERCGWRIRGDGGAAQILGLNPSTLRSRMKKLGIVRPKTTAGALSIAS